MIPRHTPPDGLNVRAGLLERDSRFEPCNRAHEMVTTGQHVAVLLKRQRRPDPGVIVRKFKSGRHDADDRVLLAVEGDLLAKNIRTAGEIALPECIAQNRDAMISIL